MVTIRSSSSELSSPALYERTSGANEESVDDIHEKKRQITDISTWSCFVRSHARTSVLACSLRSLHSPLCQIYICLFADYICVPPSYTLDFSQGVHDLALSIDVGVEETENVGENLRHTKMVVSISLLKRSRLSGSRSTRGMNGVSGEPTI